MDVIETQLFCWVEMNFYARKMHAPPAALIFASAFCEKYLALTMSGCLGICPLPSNL
jgi:hypothetical protein